MRILHKTFKRCIFEAFRHQFRLGNKQTARHTENISFKFSQNKHDESTTKTQFELRRKSWQSESFVLPLQTVRWYLILGQSVAQHLAKVSCLVTSINELFMWQVFVFQKIIARAWLITRFKIDSYRESRKMKWFSWYLFAAFALLACVKIYMSKLCNVF